MPLLLKRLRKLLLACPLCFIFLIVFTWQLVAPTAAQSKAAPDLKVNPPLEEGTTAAGISPDLSKKNVLILHAYTYETASSMIMDPIFVKGFVEAGLYVFNLHFEFMDLAKHPEQADRRELVKYLGRKFEKRPIDLIIAIHHTALNFLVEEGRDLFPGVPVINVIAHPEFLNEDFRSAYERRRRPLKHPFVILPYSANVHSTVESILSLRPDTHGLVVISGSSSLDRIMEQMVRRSLRAWQGRLSIEYFGALPLEVVLKRVATLAPETAILFANFSADPDGRAYSPPEVVQRISGAANAPVFGLFDTILGNGGLVGGIMQNHRDEAARTMRLALEILRGRLPTDPLTISSAPFIPMFDWEQLKRWGMKESRLPPGSIVLNRPRTLWGEHKGLVIGSIAVLLAQTLLVIGLLIQRNLRRKAESSVQQKTAELDQFFDVSLDLLCIANADGYFLRLNPAWERTLGYSREELIAKRFLDFIHPDDLDRTREAISTLSSQQKVSSLENRYRCKDGTYRWLQWSSAPAGKLIYAAARDVTEHKRSEESLREAEEKYRHIFEGALEGIYESSPQGKNLTANPALASMLGYDSGEELQSSVSDLANQVWVNPDERARFVQLLEEQDVFLGFETQFWRKDRRKIWVSISGRRACGPDGQTLFYSGFIEDITERKRAEEAFQEVELKYRRLYESMRDAFVRVDMSGQIQEFNSAYQTMLGYSAEELRQRSYQDLTPEKWHEMEQEIIRKQVLARGYSGVYEKEYRKKDGMVFPVELRTSLLKDETGRPTGMWAIIRDITERKRAEEALDERLRFEQLISEVSARLVNASPDRIDQEINQALGKIVNFFRVSACLLIEASPDKAMAVISHGALAHDESPVWLGANVISLFPWTSTLVPRGEIISFSSLDELPEEAAIDKQSYKGWGVRSALTIPVFFEGSISHSISFSSHTEERTWPEEYIPRLRLLAEIIVNCMKLVRTNETLRESELRLGLAGASAEMGMWTVDLETGINWGTDKQRELFGFRADEEVGLGNVLARIHPEDREKFQQGMEQAMHSQGYHQDEFRVVLPDGSIRWISSRGRLQFSVSGKPERLTGVCLDITERKRIEEALRQSEAQYRLLAENATDVIWTTDLELNLTYISPSVTRSSSYTREEIMTLKATDHLTPASLSLAARVLAEELAVEAREERNLKRSRTLELEFIRKDGSTSWDEVSVTFIRDSEGKAVGILGVSRPINERRRVEEELKRHQEHLEELVRERTGELIAARDQAEVANRAKSTFLANMSHELRTPLNSILGIAQLMERDAGFPAQHRSTLKILSHSGTHLLELINDLMEISKIEAGKMVPVITSFDLPSFLGDLEEMTRLRADQKGLKLLFEYGSHLPQYIETDVRKLRQILVNLLGNAIKYTEKGRVTLRVAFKEGVHITPEATPLSPSRLEFEIEDTGIGMAPEDTQRIFDPFVQLAPGLTAGDGTGLGLALTHMFVELLDGEITVRSQVGKGSTFKFDIVVKRAEGATIHTQEADRQVIGLMPGHPSYRLLVVDDSVGNRFVLRQLLEQSGFNILEAASGQEALDLYESGQPHLIWMDLRMPAMGGDEAARRIREAERGRRNEEGKEKRTPIIALTAGVMADERPLSHSDVFDGWVYKPFRETEVFEQLEKHLGVQFVYQPSVGSAGDGSTPRDKSALTPADLATLPANWLKEFLQALKKGRTAPLFHMIDQLRPEHGALAQSLADLVHIYRYDKLITVTAEVLKGKPNA